jgi:hypothetical protein
VTRSLIFDLVLLGLDIDDRLGKSGKVLSVSFSSCSVASRRSTASAYPSSSAHVITCHSANLIVFHGLGSSEKVSIVKSFTISDPSSVIPLMAAHVLPLAGLPIT